MANKLTTFEQLKAASVAAQNKAADVASAAAAALETLESESESKFMQRRGNVPDMDADNATDEGIYHYSGELTNFYCDDGTTGYGRMVVFNNLVTGESGAMQTWIWQIAMPTSMQIWWRIRVNAQPWTTWRRLQDSTDLDAINQAVQAVYKQTQTDNESLQEKLASAIAENHTEYLADMAQHKAEYSQLSRYVNDMLLPYQLKEYSWYGKATCATWSRLCHVKCQTSVIGSSFLIQVAATRSNVVYNELFAVSVNHSKYASISKLSTGKYSTIRVRCTVDSSGNAYFEIYDDANNCTNSTTQNLIYCRLIATRCGTVTTYTDITDGTTLDDGYDVGASMTVDKHDLQSTNGVADADRVNGYTITSGTTDMTAGSSALTTGTLYLVYK